MWEVVLLWCVISKWDAPVNHCEISQTESFARTQERCWDKADRIKHQTITRWSRKYEAPIIIQTVCVDEEGL